LDQHVKLAKAGVKLFRVDGYDVPLVAGSSAWLVCKVRPVRRCGYRTFE